MTRKKRKGSAKKHTADKPLAKELFPELNATFYTADPAGFLRMRIEALSLMTLSQEQLRDVYAAERTIGALHATSVGPPTNDERERYIATEATMIVHHAAETLLRMFFAHLEAPDCPWLGMSKMTSFIEFKGKVDKARREGFDRDDVALVFFGGSDPADTAIRASAEEFNDAVEAVRTLLSYSAHRLLSESFLYNAAKHGLTTVQLGETQMNFKTEEHDVRVHTGRMLAYLHKKAAPDAPDDGPKWHVSMTGALPHQDLAVSMSIYHALQDLWNVARRRYTATSGQVVLLTTASVESCIYAPVTNSLNVVRTVVTELSKKNEDGSLTGIDLRMIGSHVPEGWENRRDAHDGVRTVNLPVRQRDKQIEYDSHRAMLPFSPKGSPRV